MSKVVIGGELGHQIETIGFTLYENVYDIEVTSRNLKRIYVKAKATSDEFKKLQDSEKDYQDLSIEQMDEHDEIGKKLLIQSYDDIFGEGSGQKIWNGADDLYTQGITFSSFYKEFEKEMNRRQRELDKDKMQSLINKKKG